MKKNKHTNALINEKSPYLLQHAHNPVDWHSWNDEAFALARKENKPVFLSVGYSACYWCHVMEREVFENEKIAGMMNEYFVNVKVDREERPDVDRVYMTALQALTGSGGWPMSMFLTPDLKPFYGATYIPPKAKYGRAGFEDVISQIHKAWTDDNAKVKESSNLILNKLQELVNHRIANAGSEDMTKDILEVAFDKITKVYDDDNGGFGNGNKFPRPSVFNFLLDYYYHTRKFEALDITAFTLKKMYEGGMYDHLAGGFHRYSVDPYWRVPHFEKMLYDQAQLIIAYVNSFLTTKNKFYLFVAEDTAHYVLETLMNEDGGFFSAEDAESAVNADYPDEKEEGAYYLWTKKEIEKILGKEDAEIVNYYFGTLANGNTIEDPHEVFGDKNVLYIANDIFDTAKKFEKTPEEVAKLVDDSRSKLLRARIARPKPQLDDKILTSWNGLMLSALAALCKVSSGNEYLRVADKTVNFIKNNLLSDNKLLHRYREGDSAINATLEDYAFLISGLLDLYESSFELDYLTFAIDLNNIAVSIFYDNSNGGFFDVTPEEKNILLKTKDSYDGAEPSGNSVAIMNQLRLGYMTDDPALLEKSERSLNLFAPELKVSPFSSPQMLCTLSFFLHPPKEIIITGEKNNLRFLELKKAVDEIFIPNKVFLNATKELEKVSPFIVNITEGSKEEEVYVCENYSCKLPVNEAAKLKDLLQFHIP